MTRDFRFLGEVAAELRQPWWKIRHAVIAGHVEAPPVVRGRMLFAAADVEALRKHFEQPRQRVGVRSERDEGGV